MANANPVATTATTPDNTFQDLLQGVLGTADNVLGYYSKWRDSQLAYQLQRQQIAQAAAAPTLTLGPAQPGAAPEWAKYAIYGVGALALAVGAYFVVKKL